MSHSSEAQPSEWRHPHHIHVLPLSVYIGVFLALVVLTVATVAVAQVHLGGVGNLVVAMLVATVKATLVGLIFMHLLFDNKFYALVFSISLILLTVFIVFTMFDTLRRDGIYEIRAQPIRSEAEFYEELRKNAAEGEAAGHGAGDHAGQ